MAKSTVICTAAAVGGIALYLWTRSRKSYEYISEEAILDWMQNTAQHDIYASRKNFFVWKNWAQITSCAPAYIHTPSSEEEVAFIMEHASQMGVRVKVVGSGHSPNDIACTDGHMLCLDRLCKVLDIDYKQKTVTVQAGIKLKQLHEVLDLHGLALSSLGSISEQSIAGAISTGTHGTGLKYGTFSSIVRHLRLLTPSGETLDLSRDDTDEEKAAMFRAAVCGLGALGVIVRLTLQCESAFNLCAVQEKSTLPAVLSELPTLLQKHEHFRFWWIPHTNQVVTWAGNRSCDKPDPAPSAIVRYSRSVWDRVVGYHMLEGAYYMSTFMPSLVPLINKLAYAVLFPRKLVRVDRSDRVFNFDCLFKQYVSEWAIPIEHTAQAMTRLQDIIAKNSFYAHFPVEVRFGKSDDITLSPSYGRDVCWIGIIAYRPWGKEPNHTKFFSEFDTMMTQLDGRPHWAKPHPWGVEQFAKSYPMYQEFVQIYHKLNPEGLVSNAYLDRVLGPSPTPLVCKIENDPTIEDDFEHVQIDNNEDY